MRVNNPESLSREDIRHLQLERLQMTLNRAYFNVDFYRERMDGLGKLPEDVASFEDLRRFPFTTSADLAAHYPYGLFAEPLSSIVRLKMTAGAHGAPIVVGFTRRDVHRWQSLVTRLFERQGVTAKDIVQVAFNYSLFSGAFTFNHAAEAIGATLAPSATVSATLQLRIMKDFRSTVLTTTPAFALHIADTLEKGPWRRSDFGLRMILTGPDPLPEVTRERLQSVLEVPVYSLYGVTEMVEPGLAGECPVRDGLHLAEDHFLAEVVHPATGEPVPAGQEGELVLTTLTTEAYPLIRYRTGDITVLREAPCACGSSLARMIPVLRRRDHRVSVRGIPFYPEQVESLLKGLDPALTDFRLLIHTHYGMGEHLDVLVCRRSEAPFPEGSRSQYLEHLRSHLRRTLGLGARVTLTTEDNLPCEGLLHRTVFRNLQSP